VGKDLFVGIQAGPHSLHDEGIERALDLMQETAGINAILVYSQTYYNPGDRDPDALAPDHGIPVRDERARPLARVWAKPHDVYSPGGLLRLPDETGREYADRDLFAELRDPCRKRGIRLNARVLEAWGRKIALFVAGFQRVLTVDAWGRVAELCYWNNPDYRTFWLSNIEDMFKSYELDGLQFGSERVGPLSNVLLKGLVPTCFCEHCLARARDKRHRRGARPRGLRRAARDGQSARSRRAATTRRRDREPHAHPPSVSRSSSLPAVGSLGCKGTCCPRGRAWTRCGLS